MPFGAFPLFSSNLAYMASPYPPQGRYDNYQNPEEASAISTLTAMVTWLLSSLGKR